MRTIDHLFAVVSDLDAAAAQMRDMGFNLTDHGSHPGRGTANHLITLPGCYWELLAVTKPMASNAVHCIGWAFGKSGSYAGRRGPFQSLELAARTPAPGSGLNIKFR